MGFEEPKTCLPDNAQGRYGKRMTEKKSNESPNKSDQGLRRKLHEIIFEADTFWGATFDILLLLAIIASIVVISLQTVGSVGGKDAPYESLLYLLNWGFTLLFTLEYFLRLYCVRKPSSYAFSFWGIIDLLSFLPDYCILAFTGSVSGTAFAVIRALRLLRVFRILKLGWFQEEAEDLGNAVWRSRAKIVVFLTVVMIVVTVMGTLMFVVENGKPTSKFDSIPDGIYWAIVTMTTVGFGDIVPVTPSGKVLSAVLILIGYSLIIVPTGFVSAEIIGQQQKSASTISCASCITEGHDKDAIYCKYCGDRLHL